jgi:DNA-binding transcriptional regulator YdaS (Cro superfamily)
MCQTGVELIRAHKGMAVKIARGCGIKVTAVYQWSRVPAERLPQVEKISGIPRWRLRPDICPPPPGCCIRVPAPVPADNA